MCIYECIVYVYIYIYIYIHKYIQHVATIISMISNYNHTIKHTIKHYSNQSGFARALPLRCRFGRVNVRAPRDATGDAIYIYIYIYTYIHTYTYISITSPIVILLVVVLLDCGVDVVPPRAPTPIISCPNATNIYCHNYCNILLLHVYIIVKLLIAMIIIYTQGCVFNRGCEVHFPTTAGHGAGHSQPSSTEPQSRPLSTTAANIPNKILDFRGFDSSMILLLRGGILMSTGHCRETLSQRIPSNHHHHHHQHHPMW